MTTDQAIYDNQEDPRLKDPEDEVIDIYEEDYEPDMEEDIWEGKWYS